MVGQISVYAKPLFLLIIFGLYLMILAFYLPAVDNVDDAFYNNILPTIKDADIKWVAIVVYNCLKYFPLICLTVIGFFFFSNLVNERGFLGFWK